MSWKFFAGQLAAQYHWPPDVILGLTYSEMMWWLEARHEAEG